MSSIIKGYNYDIFISYRQKDNKYDGWVSEFVDNLKKELESTFKEEISVYFDINPHDGLLETHDVDESLKEKLKSLIFIPIISRTYCDPRSFAWEHEFKTFVEIASKDQTGLKVKLPNGNVAGRILPVQIHDLEPEDRKTIESVLGGFIRGIEFIYKETGVDRPLTGKDNEERNLNKTNYRNQINKVALAIKEIVSAIKHQEQLAASTPTGPSGSPAKIIRKDKSKKLTGLALILVLIVSGILFLPKIIKPGREVEKTIAVLPFRNLSRDTAQLYFCDGFTEELLNTLQKVESFSVRSRTSSDQYRDTKKSVATIGDELNVNYLVEGSVGREGNNLKIWVQLIDTKGDKHLWSNEYMREMTIEQIFSLQSEIARSIATELRAVLTTEEIEKIEKKPTENLEAYNLFLQGNYYFWKSYDSQDWEEAIRLYKESLEIDPGFALAYAKIAMSYLQQYWFYHYHNQDVLQISKEFIDRSFKTDPNLTEAHLALGEYYYMGLLEYNKAKEQFEKVLKEQPENSEAWYYLGCVYRRAGEWEMSKSCFVKACELDPKSARIVFNTGETFDLIREYDKALQYYRQAIVINPDWTYPYKDICEILIKIDGNTNRSKELLENEITRNKEILRDSLVVEDRILLKIYDGSYDKALKELTESRVDVFESQWYIRPKPLYYAFLYGLLNNQSIEHAYFDSTRIVLEKQIIDHPEDQRLYSAMGIVYAGLGFSEKAIAMSEKAIEILPVSKEAWKGVYLVENLAHTYVILGKYQEALNQLEYLLSIPGPLSTKIIELDPRWAPLKSQPGFRRLMDKYSVK